MGKNYDALHHIREQLSGYDDGLSNAIQRLFNIEDQFKQNQGCVIDSVVVAILLKKYGIESELHLGEMCADGNQDAYHCWVTVEGKIIDIGIYGNSNYNPLYRGDKLNWPIVLEDPYNIKYADGSTETNTWLSEFSKKSLIDYIKRCPGNRVIKLVCKSLDIAETTASQDMIYDLVKDMYFPELKHVEVSPSGKRGN